MKHWYTLGAIFLVFSGLLHAQVINTGITSRYDSADNGKVTVGGYVDTYYGFDFSQPATFDRPYCVSASRHNEVNINLAYVEVKYANDKVRGRFVPGVGTYINANYATEKGSLKNIVEANVGVRLSEKRNIWVDAGVLGSPFTNETAISKDHLMYTRSFAPEYVPYYLAGVKLSVPLGKKWTGYGYVLNGWQQIQDMNNPLAIATQLEFRPNDKWLLNWDTYIGNESSSDHPDWGTRWFSDIYAIYNPDGKFSLTACAYAGLQDQTDSLGVKKHLGWWQANVIGRYTFTERLSLSGRVEYFSDPHSVQIVPITPVSGFRAGSAGLCFTVKITNHALFRLENRQYFSPNTIFIDKNLTVQKFSNLIMSNLTLWF